MSIEPGQRLVANAPPPTTRPVPPPPAPASGGDRSSHYCGATIERDMLGRQLYSIAKLVGRARFGWVRVSAVNQLLITDPADEEKPR